MVVNASQTVVKNGIPDYQQAYCYGFAACGITYVEF